jgi:hypothetical protein
MGRPKLWPDGRKALDEVQENGRQRRIEPLAPPIADMIRMETVHVFNVGPWGFKENMGSLGIFFMPACEVGAPMEWERLRMRSDNGKYVPDHWEPGEKRVTDPRTEYAAMKPLPGLMAEPLPVQQDEAMWSLKDTGRYFANELLGVGIGHSVQTSHVRHGCFVAEGKKPTAEELAKARETMETDYMAEMIREADLAWAQGPMKAEAIIRPEIHHVCARWLNLGDRDWLRGTKPQGRVTCEMCGLLVDKGIATCQNGHIVDAEAYKRAHAQQEAIKKSLAEA